MIPKIQLDCCLVEFEYEVHIMNTSNRWRKIAFFVYSIFIIPMFCISSFMRHTKYCIFSEEPKIDVRLDWNGRNGNFCLYFLMSLFWFYSVISYLCPVPWIASPYTRHHCMEEVKVNWIKMVGSVLEAWFRWKNTFYFQFIVETTVSNGRELVGERSKLVLCVVLWFVSGHFHT